MWRASEESGALCVQQEKADDWQSRVAENTRRLELTVELRRENEKVDGARRRKAEKDSRLRQAEKKSKWHAVDKQIVKGRRQA